MEISIEFVSIIYKWTNQFPKEEEYGLKSQMRRASISVPSNIAEGLTRRTVNDKLHFLNIAQGSLSELDTQLELCLRLSYLQEKNFLLLEKHLIEIHKLVAGLIRSFRK